MADKLSLLAEIIKTRSRAGLTDGNIILEPIVRKAFNALFGWNLTSLNSDQVNFPAVDLGDSGMRLAIQVTNEERPSKIGSTAEKSVEHNLREHFDRVIIFFLLTKKPRFPQQFNQPVNGPIIEVWDNSDVVRLAKEVDNLTNIQNTLKVLDEELGLLYQYANHQSSSNLAQSFTANEFDHAEYGLDSSVEYLYSSFLRVEYPEKINVARITLKRGTKLSDRIKDIWRSFGEREDPPLDYYVDRSNYVFTFSSFNDPMWKELVITKSINPDRSFDSSDWSKSGKLSDRNEFTKLLQRNLEQLCSRVGTRFKLAWAKDLNCYLFQSDTKTKVGKIKVQALRKAGTREVFKAILNTLPDRRGEVQHWKHQAFRHHFVTFGGDWFLNIEPFWAFTSDGLSARSKMHSASSRNVRKPERNRAVLGHILFWASLLCKEPDLLKSPSLMRLLRPCQFTTSPSIRDLDWTNIEPEEEKNLLTENTNHELLLWLEE